MSDLFPKFDFSARRAELEAELEAVAAQLLSLRAAAAAAKEAAEAALHRFNNFAKRFNAATRHGQDEVGPALLDMLHDERLALRASNGTAMKARRVLENAEWRVSCLRSDVEQIDLLQNPPPVEHRPLEVVRRPKPQAEDGYDTIVMPTRAA
jgi:hypothetical protein